MGEHLQFTDNSEAEADQQPSALFSWQTPLSLGVAVLVLAGLFWYWDWRQVWSSLRQARAGLVALAFGVHYSTYFFRGWRWRKCLSHTGCQPSRWRLTTMVVFYQFVDNVVPAKLGDLYGAHLLKLNHGLRRSTGLGSLVFLRIVDTWCVLPMAAIGAWGIPGVWESVRWGLMGGGIVTIVLSGVLLLPIVFHRALPSWVPAGVRESLQAFGVGIWPHPGEFFGIFALTLVIWCLEISRLYLIAWALGVVLPLPTVVFLTLVPMVATALPWPPSGAGAVEFSLVWALRLVGITGPVVIAITLMDRLVAYWSHILLGLGMWAGKNYIGLSLWHPIKDGTPEEVSSEH